MKQLSRKLAAFFLTLAILLSFATLAFAHDGLDECENEVIVVASDAIEAEGAPDVSPQATCKHSYGEIQRSYVYHAGRYYSSEQCTAILRHTRVCKYCYEKTWQDYEVLGPHNVVVDSASCTGTVQTWHNSCYYCGKVQSTTTRPCPGASHIGTKCLWLPV